MLRARFDLATLACCLGPLAVGLGCNGGARGAPPASSHASAAARCGADPNAAWVDSRDRECRADSDCVHFEGDHCEMVAMAARAAQSGAYDAHRCRDFVADGGALSSLCACSIPLTERRCVQGCCQLRISGSTGPWYP